MANVNSNKKNCNSKGKNPRSKTTNREEGSKTSPVQDTRPRHNDIAWYNANPEMFKL